MAEEGLTSAKNVSHFIWMPLTEIKERQLRLIKVLNPNSHKGPSLYENKGEDKPFAQSLSRKKEEVKPVRMCGFMCL